MEEGMEEEGGRVEGEKGENGQYDERNGEERDSRRTGRPTPHLDLARSKVAPHRSPNGAILVPLDVVHAPHRLVERLLDGLLRRLVLALSDADEPFPVSDDGEGVHRGHLSFALHGDDALDDEREAVEVADLAGRELGDLGEVTDAVVLSGETIEQVV